MEYAEGMICEVNSNLNYCRTYTYDGCFVQVIINKGATVLCNADIGGVNDGMWHFAPHELTPIDFDGTQI